MNTPVPKAEVEKEPLEKTNEGQNNVVPPPKTPEAPARNVVAGVNPVRLAIDGWRKFLESNTYDFLSLSDPKDSLPQLGTMSLVLIVLSQFSLLEIGILTIFLCIVAGGVLKMLNDWAPQLHTPTPRSLVVQVFSKQYVEKQVTVVATWVTSRINVMSGLLSWDNTMTSVRAAAIAWLAYRWSDLFTPLPILIVLQLATVVCAVHKYVLKDTSALEEKALVSLAPVVESSAQKLQAHITTIRNATETNRPVFLGAALVLVALLLYVLRNVLPFFVSMSIAAIFILLHWLIEVIAPSPRALASTSSDNKDKTL